MSKIGKKLTVLPQGVSVRVEGNKVIVRGSKGEIFRTVPAGFSVVEKEGQLSVVPPDVLKKNTKAVWGALGAHVANMVKGVSEGFEKKLEFEGIGYRAEVSGKELVLSVGFTKPVRLVIPEGVSVVVAKNVITIAGIDREKVGQFAADIRRVRPPEPYKGTGIKYEGEVIKRKAGKKLAGAAGATK
ncbi:MAG: 50S ribosomal protein L6 [Parcubacteria group bacterium]|nr:50S ribosomal protein L6 [Parcubacteria group bacterium]